MDQSYLLALVVAVIVALGALGVLLSRPSSASPYPDSPFGASTEGMKICPKCGMGNLWTERRCSSCGRQLGS